MFKNLRINHTQPLILFCNNQTVMHVTLNAVFNERTKHIKMNCYKDELLFIGEKIQERIIQTA
jgi:hypothetical protein